MYLHLANVAFKAFKDIGNSVNKMESNQEIISKLKFIGKIKKGEKLIQDICILNLMVLALQ